MHLSHAIHLATLITFVHGLQWLTFHAATFGLATARLHGFTVTS